MKEIGVSVYPGVVALFLLNAESLSEEDRVSRMNDYVNIVAPFGLNHRNINVDVIHSPSTYEFSLLDLYSKHDIGDKLHARMITSIIDNLTTPLATVPFSVEKQSSHESVSQSSEQLLDVVSNTPIKNFVATPPKVCVAKKIKGKITESPVNKGTTVMS